MMKKQLFSFLSIFGIATAVALFVRGCCIEDYRISSGSMYPNLLEGDLVFVSKYDFNIRFPFSAYTLLNFRRPRRAEIVAFTLPDHKYETFVKRVIAVEGEKVTIKDGIVYINEAPAQYKPLTSNAREVAQTEGSAPTWEEIAPGVGYRIEKSLEPVKDYGPIEVPKGHFFALGDNRKDSIDSRIWGPIPLSCLKGRVALVWVSLDNRGKVRKDRTALWIN